MIEPDQKCRICTLITGHYRILQHVEIRWKWAKRGLAQNSVFPENRMTSSLTS